MNQNTLLAAGLVGVVVIGGYFVYKSISAPVQQQTTGCSGDWTDYINPGCWYSGLTTGLSNEVNTATNEINTILIILAVVAVLLVGLLAFGPQTAHIAGAAKFLV